MKPLDVLLILVSILFATGFLVDQRWGPERKRHRAQVRFQQARLDLVARELREYHDRNGRFPTTEEGLDVVPGLRDASLSGDFAILREHLEPLPGVRTVHGIPFVYENRRPGVGGNRSRAYKASPARLDRKDRRRWSRKVSDRIFVSDVGLRHDAERVFGRAWLDALLIFSGSVILVLAVAYTIARNRKSQDRVRGVNAMIVVGVALLLLAVIGITKGGGALGRRDPPFVFEPGPLRADLLEEYLGILRSFVSEGVFDPDVFARRERELRAEFGLLPADEAAPAPGGDAGGSGG